MELHIYLLYTTGYMMKKRFQSSLISGKLKVTVLFITVKIESHIATPMLNIKIYSQIVVYFYRTRLHSLNFSVNFSHNYKKEIF